MVPGREARRKRPALTDNEQTPALPEIEQNRLIIS